jgi:hypothetical protein
MASLQYKAEGFIWFHKLPEAVARARRRFRIQFAAKLPFKEATGHWHENFSPAKVRVPISHQHVTMLWIMSEKHLFEIHQSQRKSQQ